MTVPNLPLYLLSLLLVLLSGQLLCSAFVPGYAVVESSSEDFLQGTLQLLDGSGSPYGGDYEFLEYSIQARTEQVLRILIHPVVNQTDSPGYGRRWRIPDYVLQGDIVQANISLASNASAMYSVTIAPSPFSVIVTRTDSGEAIWNTTQASSPSFNGLIFSQQYLEWSSSLLPSAPGAYPALYGLGERVAPFQLNASNPTGQSYGMFNRDQGAALQHRNLYGTHPFYMQMVNGRAHGVFMANTNAQSVNLSSTSLSWQIIGGVIDLWLIVGNSPMQVAQSYAEIVGRPHLPPYWGLGWHQCRWGYHTIQETNEVVEKYALYNLPLDTMWNDIDYMDEYMDFTLDPDRFPVSEVQKFVETLHENHQHYIIITDPGIKVQDGYAPYEDGNKQNVWVMDYSREKAIEGKVWPGITVFPDFFHPNATAYWLNQIASFHANGPMFDGLWIDMNEVDSFCAGACNETSAATPSFDPWDNPPFDPVNAPLNASTLSMSSVQHSGLHYDVHNLYGWSETRATDIALEGLLGKRTMVISRSTFAGSGYWGGHWLGDNFSTWEDMALSISGVLNFQLFQIPLVGADICGFNLETTAELCSRWMQLGVLYPFSRNHNSIYMRPQEPYALGEQHLEISRNAIRTRYLLLPYLYTLFFEAHQKGITVWRPLFFEFPEDSATLAIDQQFLVGDALLATPVLTKGASSVSGYFPAAVWYDFYTGERVGSSSNGTWLHLDAPITTIPLHLRGGRIIPAQTPSTTSHEARGLPMILMIMLDDEGDASGQLVWDDGESLHSTSVYTRVQFSAVSSSNSVLVQGTTVQSEYSEADQVNIGILSLYGVQSKPSSIYVNQMEITSYDYSKQYKTLKISGLLLTLTSNWSVTITI